MDEIGTFVFMDDDLSFDEDFFYKNLDRVKDGTVIWMDPPFICFITKADFAKTGGFDERIKPIMGMESEFRYRLMILGIEIKDVAGGVRHFGGKSTKQKERWNQKNLTFTYLIYWKSWKKLGLFKRKNPVEFGRRILWFLEWLIVFHIQKRSNFLR
jgi:GT2 family glycosyltransferase